MPRSPADAFFYVIAVVEHDGRYLLVQENDHSWFLPAGGVELPEDLPSAVIRETREEAGVEVLPVSLLRAEYRWYPGENGISAWMRFTIRAALTGSPDPKQEPDHHSLRAGWFSIQQIESMRLRGPEVLDIVRSVRDRHPELPLPVAV